MTALEFEKQYAEDAHISVEQLRARGRVVVPCLDGELCDHPDCPGWNSLPRDVATDYQMMGRIPKNWVWPPA